MRRTHLAACAAIVAVLVAAPAALAKPTTWTRHGSSAW